MTSRYGQFTGEEQFIADGKPTGETIKSFWSWAYSELDSNIVRSVLAEYIVATALGISDSPDECFREMWRPFDLMFENIRIEVKSASTIQAWETKHKGKFTFSIAPARVPDENGNYLDDAPMQRNCDVYVFCIFAPDEESNTPLNLDDWTFYVLSTKVLDEKLPNQKNISFNPLLDMSPIKTGYHGLKDAVVSAYNRESD